MLLATLATGLATAPLHAAPEPASTGDVAADWILSKLARPAPSHTPFVELRDKGQGYAVSLVKAGVRLRGLDVGEVRPPLHEPAGDHLKQLAQLIERGQALLEEGM